MAQDVSAIERITEAPVSVEPADIEAQFNRIWDETTSGGLDDSTVRLRVLNLVGIAQSPDARARFEALMMELPERHPGRGIFADATSERGGVEASISAHCWRAPGGSRHVCSEEVTLTAPPAKQQALASAVLALLVPELPVAAWLIGGAVLEGDLVREVIEEADRVFIDTAGASDLRATFRSALHAAEEHSVELCDLAWCRSETWRSLVAQFFDSPERMRELSQLRSVRIVVGGERITSEALLLGGWFISRLGLTFADLDANERSIVATLYDRTRAVRVGLASGGPAGLPVQEVRIETDGASFLVEMHEANGHMHVREEWPDGPARQVVEQLPLDDAAILSDALDSVDEPLLYLAALASAIELLGDADPTGTRGGRA